LIPSRRDFPRIGAGKPADHIRARLKPGYRGIKQTLSEGFAQAKRK
jgi:hypothetical protein